MKHFPFFKKKHIEEESRKIRANDPESNALNNFAGNEVSTARYNLATFLPKNLFEQFHRLANAYFLFLVCLQLIPQISSLPPYTTIVPLCFVLILTAIKDAVDDFGRHKSDKEVNNRETQVIYQNDIVYRKWKEIQVGDMIQLSNDEFVTADIFIISTSEPNGLCYIETAELDGETNLKARQSLEETQGIGDDVDDLSNFNGEIECEPANNNLNKFQGNLTWNNKTYPLKNENVLLRGTRLRNTQWVVGIVCYAGSDTKLMKNTNKPSFKRSHIDRLLDKIIIGILIFLVLLCATMSICCIFWESNVGYYFRSYLPWESYISNNKTKGSIQLGLLVFLSYVITLSAVVPISLYVSIEFVRLLQSKWIDWDINMYYEPNNVPAHVKTTTLNEELGQIQYIFSDKTGTLTQNIMTFKKCSIQGKLYGYVMDNNGNEIQDPNKLESIELNDQDKDFVWYDKTLLDDIEKDDENVHKFFTLLSLCHTVMPEKRDGKIFYQAQSPDENALVSAARSFGFAFQNRTQSSITIKIKDKEETYNLLNILDFTNERQRMSVIVEKDNVIYLYCKGGDTKIKERLNDSQKDIMKQTDEHLNNFANESLRTLCLAWKQLDKSQYDQWATKLNTAKVRSKLPRTRTRTLNPNPNPKPEPEPVPEPEPEPEPELYTSMEERDEKVAEMYEEIEQDLILLGATAIEDKLQDGVPQCIERLTRAGIKIWVLTGDKIETAYNIGLSCRLLTNEMEIKTIEENDEESVKAKLEDIRNSMIEKIEYLFNVNIDDRDKRLDWNQWNIDVLNFDKHRKKSSNDDIKIRSTKSVRFTTDDKSINEDDDDIHREPFEGFAILITGQALIHALSSDLCMKFLELATMCKAVICCRVTPMQKAQVVELVMKHENKITLAIGDGANDVSMIQKAHIGIGISGQEGRQAVLASDFSFGQFRYLERLLLIHGRLSYVRVSKFLRYFFYKNFAYTFCHFWFAFFSAYSAQSLYDPMFGALYNSLFSTFPIIILSIFDRDVNDYYSLNKPYLYTPGQTNRFFNKKILLKSIVHGILSSLVIYFISYLSLSHKTINGRIAEIDLQSFGFLIGTIIIIVVNLENALEIWYWTSYYHISLWLTIFIYFIFHLTLYSSFMIKIFKQNYTYVGVAKFILLDSNFWFILLLSSVILLLPRFFNEFYRMRFNPNETDKARLNEKYRYEEKSAFIQHINVQKNILRKRLPRSSYAFAQQEGWGQLITSGKMKVQQIAFPRTSQDNNILLRKSRLSHHHHHNLTGTI
ncbi:unnamed protein product [Adineta steineri]|uniref:Phospholipid-transporting ATPase n=3 Tax=Adineta steineri TaxID=433720 RepID=A0A814XMD5_9BILA|nr:unnamed protein product [Adineta steineri]CAF3521398.1 unnamed protein product [Adineta steineri]